MGLGSFILSKKLHCLGFTLSSTLEKLLFRKGVAKLITVGYRRAMTIRSYVTDVASVLFVSVSVFYDNY